VDAKTAHALNAINRAFYGDLAEEFSATREAPWPGWLRLLSAIESHYPTADLDVLDIGCGNGRFAKFLADYLPIRRERLRYLGIDASAAMLERAGATTLPFASTQYRMWDFVEAPLEEWLSDRNFSLTVLFGLLHHVPGAERRRALVRDAALSLRPGGLLAFTSWQFEKIARLRKKAISWEEFNLSAELPIDVEQLEAGDRLLHWGDSGRVVRYCHFAGEEETTQLTLDLPLELVETFSADGREGNLNRYFIFRRLQTVPS